MIFDIFQFYSFLKICLIKFQWFLKKILRIWKCINVLKNANNILKMKKIFTWIFSFK